MDLDGLSVRSLDRTVRPIALFMSVCAPSECIISSLFAGLGVLEATDHHQSRQLS